MGLTLRLTNDEEAALRVRAETDGISVQEAARRAVREFVARGRHHDRVDAASHLVSERHAETIRRLGE